MKWSIDGIEWSYPCSIVRKADIEASDISGMMLNRTYYNDVIATYMSYDVSIAVPAGEENDYAEIYEEVTKPVPYHEFKFPYNYLANGITFNGRVENIEDTFVKIAGGHTWRKISFEAIAVTPSKAIEGNVLENYGLSPYPQVVSPTIGDLFEFTANGWVQRFYSDADSTEY